jgi:hypothetical protein
MALSHDTKIFIVAHYAGEKYWLISAENQRDRNGRLVLQGKWGKPSEAQPVSLELGTVYRRRFIEETHCDVHFTLSAGSSEYVEEPNSSSSQGEDIRQPMQYRGLLAHPGIDTKTGTRCWYVKTFAGPMQLESIRGATPEEAVDRAYERNLQHKSEKAPPPPQVVAPQPAAPAGPRLRPGSLR